MTLRHSGARCLLTWRPFPNPNRRPH